MSALLAFGKLNNIMFLSGIYVLSLVLRGKAFAHDSMGRRIDPSWWTSRLVKK